MQKSELRALVRKEVHDSVSEVVTEVVTASAWSAPIPHPDDFAGYEAVVPGGAKAILDTFTEQSRHRREAEALVVRGSERRADRGQLLVFGLIAALIVIGTLLAFLVDPWAGVTAMGLGFGGGVWVYIVGGRPPSERPPTKTGQDTDS